MTQTEDHDTIGFIGLGNMGAPMCDCLLEAGFAVVAFDLDQTKVEHAVAGGALAATSAADCAAQADVLLTSLPRPEHVEAVMETGGALAALRAGSLWVDLTIVRTAMPASPKQRSRCATGRLAGHWRRRRCPQRPAHPFHWRR